MSYKVISKKTLKEFWLEHQDCAQHLKTWHEDVRAASWENPAELKNQFPSASILKDGRVVFNIKGNDYRLVGWVNYRRKWIYIRFIGTHAEYDRIDANTI